MGSDTQKHQRSASKTKGIILITALLVLLTLAHLFFSSTPTPQKEAYTTKHLKPHNYYNTSSPSFSPSPFPFCSPAQNPKYPPHTLSKTHLHTGTLTRLKHHLSLALSGAPTTLSILGGSISACHGAGDDPISPKCYPHKLFTAYTHLFPHPSSELTNGAMRKTGSDYFGYCASNHLPDDPSIVIIDLDTTDSPGEPALAPFELLLRSVLALPSHPAVILLSHWSPQTHLTHGFLGAAHWHLSLSHFYDIPHISIAPVLLPLYLKDPEGTVRTYNTDMLLSNEKGHEVMKDVLQSFIEQVVCQVWDESSPNNNEPEKPGLLAGLGPRPGSSPDSLSSSPSSDTHSSLTLFSLPPTLLTSPSHSLPLIEPSPFCASANDLVNPLPPSLFYGSGWAAYHPGAAGGSRSKNEEKGPSGHYWYASMPTSKIRVPIKTARGDVGVYYISGLSQEDKEAMKKDGESEGGTEEGSALECWVDDNYAGAKVLENAGGDGGVVLQMIDHNVSGGSHFVECQLLGEEGVRVRPFKIVGVFGT